MEEKQGHKTFHLQGKDPCYYEEVPRNFQDTSYREVRVCLLDLPGPEGDNEVVPFHIRHGKDY